MEIIVCIKPVLDPDLPPAKFTVDGKKNEVIPPEGVPFVMSPYDALAVEAALRIKEAQGGKITVLTQGTKYAEEIMRKALAMGADEGVILSDPAFEDSDGFGTAHVLAQTVKKIGKFDLILCGRQAADWDAGVVGSLIAEYLNIPVVIRAKSIEVLDGVLKIERISTNGSEVFELGLPALVTLSSEMGQVRIPSGWGIISAAKKQVPKWGATDIGTDPSQTGAAAAVNRLVKLYVPVYERKCEMVTGKDPAEAAARLTEKILAIKP
ncbi:MAG: electron transfer flavoprotein subunit beta/FixA family protein [Syntrophales bacterium]|jgi:electron transfer flavoprotein beta subunit|nr:electron transfer flavoprotein subunit beta/FixA family protein [Syntrophales bacterium]MCK9392345.1 electron transfer flavoprotein subunit beta/FixA family protein [Syntrophales bacterium]